MDLEAGCWQNWQKLCLGQEVEHLFELHGTVADQLRSGRPQKVSTKAAHQATTATQDLDCKTAGAVAVTAQQQSGVNMTFSTTTRYLRK
jgi:hypothetical protein